RHAERAATAFARRQARRVAGLFRARHRAFGRPGFVDQGRICTALCTARLRSCTTRPAPPGSARVARRGARADTVQRSGQGGSGAAARILGGLLLMAHAHPSSYVFRLGARGVSPLRSRLAAVLGALVLGALTSAAAAVELKVATIAPDGSHWMN